MKIPKRIFQVWIGDINNINPEWLEAKKTIIDMNPTWKYYFITTKKALGIIKKHFPDFLDTYNNFEYDIQRADAIRYILLYLYGGIYLDLDFIALKPFDNIIDKLEFEIGVLESTNVKNVITNSFLVSIQKSNFWLDVIKEMKKEKPFWAITKHLEIMITTGPYMFNNLYKKNKNYITILKNITVPCNVCNIDKCEAKNNYYILPIKGQSWNSIDSHIFNFIMCNKSELLISTILLLFMFKK